MLLHANLQFVEPATKLQIQRRFPLIWWAIPTTLMDVPNKLLLIRNPETNAKTLKRHGIGRAKVWHAHGHGEKFRIVCCFTNGTFQGEPTIVINGVTWVAPISRNKNIYKLRSCKVGPTSYKMLYKWSYGAPISRIISPQ